MRNHHHRMKTIFRFWLRPSRTIDELEQLPPNELKIRINFLFIAQSLLFAIQKPEQLNVVNLNEFLQAIAMLTLQTFFIFLAVKYAQTILFWALCKLFEGKADMQKIRMAISFSQSPFIILLPFAILHYVAVLLSSDVTYKFSSPTYLLFIFSLITFSYFVISLSKVSRFSYKYGILSVFLIASLGELLRLLISH